MMNRRQRFICQALVIWLLGVTAIAVSDYVDQEKYERQKDVGATKLAAVSTMREVKPQSERVLRFEVHQGGSYQPKVNYIAETVVKEQVYESLEIPQGDCSSFLYMDYRAITDTSSKQWELQQIAWTDSDGFRRIGDDYCVALGTYYGNIGDRFRITTDKGNSYTAIEADAKGSDAVFYDNVHSWYHYAGNGYNVVEFVVQTEYLPSAVTISGSCGAVDYLSGNIVSIERI